MRPHVFHVLCLFLLLEPSFEIDAVAHGACASGQCCIAAEPDDPAAFLQLGVRVTSRSPTDSDITLTNDRLNTLATGTIARYRTDAHNAGLTLAGARLRASTEADGPLDPYSVVQTGSEDNERANSFDEGDALDAEADDVQDDQEEPPDWVGAMDSLAEWMTQSYVVPENKGRSERALPAAGSIVPPMMASLPLDIAHKHEGNLQSFIVACIISVSVLVVTLLLFSCCRKQWPEVYSKVRNNEDQKTSRKLNSFFGWTKVFCRGITYPYLSRADYTKVEQHAGLDQAMLLEFFKMSTSVFIFVGCPMLVVMIMHALSGGGVVGGDHLAVLSLTNVGKDSWLLWVHALITWYVVIVTQWLIAGEQRKFAKRRESWLQAMPAIQSKTVLLENIPKDYRTDTKVAQHLQQVLKADAGDKLQVESVHVVKYLGELSAKYNRLKELNEHLKDAIDENQVTEKRPKVGDQDAITLYTAKISDLKRQIEMLRNQIRQSLPQGVQADLRDLHSASAFVTFKTNITPFVSFVQSRLRSKAQANPVRPVVSPGALPFSVDEGDWQVSLAPEPADVNYDALLKPAESKTLMQGLGSAIIALLFFAYVPIVLLISKYSHIDVQDVKGVSRGAIIYNAVFQCIALGFVVSFIPFFLSLICSKFFCMRSGVETQAFIQNFHFFFLVLLVHIVTGVGPMFISCVSSPTTCNQHLVDLGEFYLKWLPIQLCAIELFELLRLFPLCNFFRHQAIGASSRRAAELCDPDDNIYFASGWQYNGKGSRSARFAHMYVVALCFCQIQPLINLVAVIFFVFCQLMYAYMLRFAENPTPDSGGIYWVQMLVHVQLFSLLYIVVMAVFLMKKASSPGPSIIALASSFWWLYQIMYHRVYMDMSSGPPIPQTQMRPSTRDTYEQPEMTDWPGEEAKVVLPVSLEQRDDAEAGDAGTMPVDNEDMQHLQGYERPSTELSIHSPPKVPQQSSAGESQSSAMPPPNGYQQKAAVDSRPSTQQSLSTAPNSPPQRVTLSECC